MKTKKCVEHKEEVEKDLADTKVKHDVATKALEEAKEELEAARNDTHVKDADLRALKEAVEKRQQRKEEEEKKLKDAQ